jgi:Tfp pilus assembly protein PilX
MNMPASLNKQSGITLFMGMIMLVLITLMVTSAFMLSNTNLMAVGNMQAKDEAIAAANVAIERVLSSPFTVAPAADMHEVDINNDGISEYIVDVATPQCISAAIDTQSAKSSVVLAGMTISSWNTLWDIVAEVNDVKTGAKTKVNVGVRVLLTETQKNAVCS